MNIHFKTTIIALGACVLALSSCKKDDEPEVMNPTPPADRSVTVEMSQQWGDEALDMSSDYMIGDLAVKFDVIKFYMSGLTAISDGGADMVEFDKVLLIDASTDFSEVLGDVEFNYVNMLQYAIGLDAETNHTEDPANAPEPLNQIDMHWNWNSDAGYKFIRIEGFYDANDDGQPTEYFELHIATDNVYREGSVMVNTDVDDDGTHIHLEMDYQQFFDGIDFTPADYDFGDVHGSSTITNAIATNAAEAISAG